jgi:catechol 2,3-dioxygenase-like lactoylglutathione lyase family enzyme
MSSGGFRRRILDHHDRGGSAVATEVSTTLNLTRVGRVCIPTSDSDRALEFYVGTLGFEKVVDVPMGPDARWIELQVSGAETTIAIAPPPPGVEVGGSQTGIILDTTDIEADHAALKAAGADVDDEISRMGGDVPPMFWIRDPEGNSLIVVQPNDR